MGESRNRRVVVGQRGGPEVLQLIDEELPSPGVGEIRVRVEAAGVSGLDVMLRTRRFPGFPKPPFTPGVDVVGIVDELGSGVSSVSVGDRIGALLGFNGGYAEHVCVKAADAVPVPGGSDAAEAVCVVANYLTAHTAMHRVGEVEVGDRALIHGAAGGVGTALVELGALAGLEMYGTASPSSHRLVESMGATPIDYRSEDFVARIRTLTGDGVDVVFDPVGGARQLWRSYRTLRRGGRLVWFGVAASKRHGASVIPASLAMRALLGVLPDGRRALTTPDLLRDNAAYRSDLTELFELLAAGKIAPVVAGRIPLADAARAHERIERGGYRGKFVLTTA